MDVASQIRLELTEATENLARLRLVARAGDELPGVVAVAGQVVGPRCAYARTLPAAWPLAADSTRSPGELALAAVFPEPCYWTSDLPFLYEALVEARLASGELHPLVHTFGLRRLEVAGRSFRLERKRSVFRGAVQSDLSDANLGTAHNADATLIARDASEAELLRADEIGARLIIDMSRSQGDLQRLGPDISWHPSVHALFVSEGNRLDKGSRVPLGLAIDVLRGSSEAAAGAADFVAIYLNANERPPAWVARLDKPVIVIRRGTAYADIQRARSACDALQAELAPEFDLAGYFVSNE
jgi:hypothetical protein